MNFKLWLENDLSDLRYENPNTVLWDDMPTFIYVEDTDQLICGEWASHGVLLRDNGIEKHKDGYIVLPNGTQTKKASFGRYGISKEHGINLVVVWPTWNRMKLTYSLLEKTLHKLLTVHRPDLGTTNSPLPITKNFYVVSDIVPPFKISDKISGKTGEGLLPQEAELKEMLGQLHFLPRNHPRRAEIKELATDLKKQGKYKWFTDIALKEPNHQPNSWGQEFKKQDLIKPGQKYWAMQSENTSQ